MKKKLLALTLTLVLALSLTACNKQTAYINENLKDKDITVENLLEYGIPREKTMNYHVDMTLESRQATESTPEEIDLDFTLNADMISDPVNSTSHTHGTMNIKTYGQNMDYPMNTYSWKDYVWEQDGDTQEWAVYNDPSYVTNDKTGIMGLTRESFSEIVLNSDGPEHRIDGKLDMNAANPAVSTIMSLTGHNAPDVETLVNITFDKTTLCMTGLTLKIETSASNGTGDFTLEGFEYKVTVKSFDDVRLEIPEELPSSNVVNQYHPDTSDGIEILTPEENEDGSDDLVFVIPSDLSED